MQTEVNWSHRNNFMLNENMYFVWKIYTYWKYNFEKKYANRKYVWSFKKYTIIKKTFMEIKWIYMFLDKY